jgi:hypothetical protein
MRMVQRQCQGRIISKCQVCGEKLKTPVREDIMPHPLAMATCEKESCHKFALQVWLNKPSGVI